LENTHHKFMQRCLEIAKQGAGNTSPNPLVGSVIVYDGKIIGEGYHRKCGEPHAEINAINSVKDYSLLQKSTLYVNLEPCSHYGKTPPCAERIAQLKIPRVVVGIKDLSAKVNGKGINIMKNAGIDVTTGIMEAESYELNRRFFTFHQKNRPYIILKWAQSQDNFIDIKRTTSNQPQIHWITNELSKSLVHKWRTEEDAILIGFNTALKDDPQLTVREWTGKQPLRLVFDKNLVLSKNLHIFDKQNPTIIFNANKSEIQKNLTFALLNYANDILPQILLVLYQKNILSVIVEGGRITLQSFIDLNLWDEARVFTGAVKFKSGVPAPLFPYLPKHTMHLMESKLDYYRNNL